MDLNEQLNKKSIVDIEVCEISQGIFDVIMNFVVSNSPCLQL